MTERIVVCFRAIELEVEPQEYLRAARTLCERAAALGARLISWGATLYAFELDPDALQDAIELSLSATRSSRSRPDSAVGVSHGSLETMEEATAKQPVRWGHPLVRAAALARGARAGEVLLDPTLPAVERGDLVTAGARVSLYGRLRIRGLLLDTAHPWRSAAPPDRIGFSRPPFIERSELAALADAGQGLSVLRAAPGFGGSRLLEEIARTTEQTRVVHVSPHGLGEPLGALRAAMSRAVSSNQGPIGLSSGLEQSLDTLLGGEGLDPDSGAELLAAWIAGDSSGAPGGIVLVDDASRVDADTLEVIAQAYANAPEPFRVVARLGPADAVPAAFLAIPGARDVDVGTMRKEQAEELAAFAAGGALDAPAKAEWATRGGCVPLSVVEAVRESVETNEIAWDEGRAAARGRPGAASGPRPPAFWARKRLARRDPSERRVLAALAVLGGQASRAEIAAVVRRAEPSLGVDEALSVLGASAWVEFEAQGLCSLPSATHRETVIQCMNDGEFAALHRAAAEVCEKGDRPLASVSATVHYVLAGDAERAREVARLAAAATRAIGLEATAKSLERLSDYDDIDALASRNSFGAELEAARPPPPRESRSSRASDLPRASRRPRSGSTGPSERPRTFVAGASDSPVRALEALRKGDAASVERLARELRVDEARSGLAERLQAMADLARGDTGDAIRRLRDAADEARKTKSRDRCRSLLALGVALAAANRKEEALLEALDALARAREAKDDRGERACLLFLAQLTTGAGHGGVAAAWASAAEG